jgi:hypothetical protein
MDDLITRLRTLMAEVEARIQQGEVLGDEDISPKLKEALRLPAVGADVGAEPKPRSDPPMTSKAYGPSMADDRSATPARDIKLDDYVPSRHDPMHAHEGFDPEDFVGTGDRDPLGHDEAIRR